MTDSRKHSRLLQYGSNYTFKCFLQTLKANVLKRFTFVAQWCNISTHKSEIEGLNHYHRHREEENISI